MSKSINSKAYKLKHLLTNWQV